MGCDIPGNLPFSFYWDPFLSTRGCLLSPKHSDSAITWLINTCIGKFCTWVFKQVSLELIILLEKNKILFKIFLVYFCESWLFDEVFDSFIDLLFAKVYSICVLLWYFFPRYSFEATLDAIIHWSIPRGLFSKSLIHN